MRRHLLDISFSAQESAFGLWLIHNLEKSLHIDSLIIGIAKICFSFKGDEKVETKKNYRRNNFKSEEVLLPLKQKSQVINKTAICFFHEVYSPSKRI